MSTPDTRGKDPAKTVEAEKKKTTSKKTTRKGKKGTKCPKSEINKMEDAMAFTMESRHYQSIAIMHEQRCTSLVSVTVQSFAQLKDMIMSEIGGDLEGYSLLNMAHFEQPVIELPQEPVLMLRLTPPQAKEPTPISDRSRHRQAFSEQVASSSQLSKSYESYCRSRAKMYLGDRVVAQLEESDSVSKTLHDLLSVLRFDEAETNSRWEEQCNRIPHFKAAGELLLSSFQHRAALYGCNELAWVAHFLGTLSLGGHAPDLSRFTMDGDVALQGARGIPQTTTNNWVRPDLSIGISASGSEWDKLRAGKAILPLDIVEFKRDKADSEEGWYRLLYAAIVCAFHQLDLLDALLDKEPSAASFSAAIPLTLATLMNGADFRMACVWHVRGRGLHVGVLFDRRIENVTVLKQCFLLRHEAINVAIRFGTMVRGFHLHDQRGPRVDVWWSQFCTCEKKDDGKHYVLCTECQNWFHPKCVGLDITNIPRGTTPWYCPKHMRPTKPGLLKAEAEPKEDHGPRDGAGGQPATATSSMLKPIRRLFQNSKSDIWLCHRADTSTTAGYEEVVVKLVESREHASEEARVLRHLRHVPHVAQLLDVIDCCLPESTVCSGLVMPYYPLSAADAHGISSAQLDSDLKFTRYARQLLEALHGVHERRIIHRDISHANVVFTTAARDASVAGEHGTTILLDFDLATDEDAVRGTRQEPWGTKGYVAPETLKFGEVSCKSDMWSAGALLAFQMLGVWPRSDMETQTVAQMSLAEAKAWVQQLEPARWWWKAVPTPYLSKGRWALVQGMLTFDPAARLDAALALHQFDICWSAPPSRAATPAKQSTSPVPQHHAK